MNKTEREIRKEAADYTGRSEALRSEELNQEILKELQEFDPVSFVRNMRTMREVSERLDEHIEKQREVFGLDDAKREDIEMTYALKMDLLYHQAFAIHPLTSFGRQCLEEAVKLRKEFEELVGVYTTRITASNISVFLPVLTKDLAEDIRTGRREAIGAIRSKGVRSYGAGALVYDLEGEALDGSSIIRIEWLFVHPDFRGRRIADSLIAEMVFQMQKNHVETLTASFIVGDSWEPVIGTIFSRWKFLFGTQMDKDTIISLGDVIDPEPLETIRETSGKKLTPLSAIEEKNIPAFLRSALRRDKYRGYLWKQTGNPGYFDLTLSCFAGDRRNPDGVILVHRTPSGILRAEYAGPSDADTGTIISLAGNVLYQAFNTESSSVLDLPIYMGAFEKKLEEAVPNQKSALLVTAVLSADLPEEDVSAQDVEELLSLPEEGLSEEIQRIAG